MNTPKKILLVGGGTAGSVAPLLALVDEWRGQKDEVEFLLVGTRRGPEKEMAAAAGVPFTAILSGKWRRYFSLKNFIDPFKVLIAFFQSLLLLKRFKPDVIITAGSFVSVPIVWAGKILGVPAVVHQQDLRPGLANKLMAPAARVITVVFKKSLADYGPRAVWVGNPVRSAFKNKRAADRSFFSLANSRPTVLVFGGGTGAEWLNGAIMEIKAEIEKFANLIWITGRGKGSGQGFEFLDAERMADAYSFADLVVSRSGLGALTEIAYLKKAAILIPLPDSHQEDNARVFQEAGAAVVLNQKKISPNDLLAEIKAVLLDQGKRKGMAERIGEVIRTGAEKEMIKIIKNIIL